jgi:hypothetical protein
MTLTQLPILIAITPLQVTAPNRRLLHKSQLTSHKKAANAVASAAEKRIARSIDMD